MHQAGDVMSKNIVTLHQDASVGEAIQALLDHAISGAPIVDDDGRLVGIISEFQLLEAVYSPEVKQHRVRSLMTKEVLTIEDTATLLEVANMFVLHRIRRVPVLRDGKMVGIIARRDLLRHVAEADEVLSGLSQKTPAAATV